MEITILGSGTFKPELNRHCSSYLIKAGNENLIFDFGRGTLDQIMKSGTKYYTINKIFITHAHSDHCSELIPFIGVFASLFWTNFPYPENKKLKKQKIIIYGPKGIKETIFHFLKALAWDKGKYIDNLKIKELSDGDTIEGKNWKVKCFNTEHSGRIGSFAYRIETGNKIAAYCGDGIYSKGMVDACKNADIAILEATLPPSLNPTKNGHLSAGDAGKIADEANVKKLVLTHISPEYFKFNPKKETKKYYKGKVIIAKDMMKFKIK
jgi:ribonuclease BN (tRNA processing enzyme)